MANKQEFVTKYNPRATWITRASFMKIALFSFPCILMANSSPGLPVFKLQDVKVKTDTTRLRAIIMNQKFSNVVITSTNRKKSRQHDEQIEIPGNYLKLKNCACN